MAMLPVLKNEVRPMLFKFELYVLHNSLQIVQLQLCTDRFTAYTQTYLCWLRAFLLAFIVDFHVERFELPLI
jgi:hypothetical protein